MLQLLFFFVLFVLSKSQTLSLTEHYYNLVSKHGNSIPKQSSSSINPSFSDPIRVIGLVGNENIIPRSLTQKSGELVVDQDGMFYRVLPRKLRVGEFMARSFIIPRSLTDKNGELVIGSNGMLFRVLPRKTRVGEIMSKSFVYSPNTS